MKKESSITGFQYFNDVTFSFKTSSLYLFAGVVITGKQFFLIPMDKFSKAIEKSLIVKQIENEMIKKGIPKIMNKANTNAIV